MRRARVRRSRDSHRSLTERTPRLASRSAAARRNDFRGYDIRFASLSISRKSSPRPRFPLNAKNIVDSHNKGLRVPGHLCVD